MTDSDVERKVRKAVYAEVARKQGYVPYGVSWDVASRIRVLSDVTRDVALGEYTNVRIYNLNHVVRFGRRDRVLVGSAGRKIQSQNIDIFYVRPSSKKRAEGERVVFTLDVLDGISGDVRMMQI